MIQRVSDFNILNEKDMDKLAKVVEKQDSTKLFDVVDDENKVKLIKKQLQLQGYKVKVEPFGDKWKVYAIISDKVKYEEAAESGQFNKLAWGRYSFQRESALGMNKYDFDDGSIWHLITGEDGKEYLVKEVDDENEENIVRTKVASNNEFNIVNDNNIKDILAVLYDDDSFKVTRELVNSDLKSQFYNFLNKRLACEIEARINENHFISSPKYSDDIKSLVATAINNREITSRDKLDNLIVEYSNSVVKKTGKVESLFD